MVTATAGGRLRRSRYPFEGGLQAWSQRGAIGGTWWSQRFITLLEMVGIGGRLQRGKRYARTGQVISMQVKPGKVTASVQGSRATPYKVSIATKVLSAAEWKAAEDVMAKSAVFMAKLLAGEMPEEIEEAFVGSSGPLLPQSARDFESDCSCPDWENPCKHIAAVYFLLAEDFDRDPFLIFSVAWPRQGDSAYEPSQAATRFGECHQAETSGPVRSRRGLSHHRSWRIRLASLGSGRGAGPAL